MKKSDLERYDKYQIKEVNGIRQFDKDGAPVLDTKLRTATLSPQEAKFLNERASWYGVVYVKQEEAEKASQEKPADEKPDELKAENQDGNNIDALKRQAKELGIKGSHSMKEETLIKRIEEKVK